jgi:hypothetical protein
MAEKSKYRNTQNICRIRKGGDLLNGYTSQKSKLSLSLKLCALNNDNNSIIIIRLCV